MTLECGKTSLFDVVVGGEYAIAHIPDISLLSVSRKGDMGGHRLPNQ